MLVVFSYPSFFFERLEILIHLKKFVIIMACEDGDCEVYIERDKSKYIKELVQYIQEFITHKLKEYA